MKKFIAMIAFVPVLLALLLAGCTIDHPEHPTGLEDITNGEPFMALGNSLTAGYMDSGLMMNGQMGSFPLLVARQMGLDVTPGTGEFTQPLIASPGIGGLSGDQVNGVLHYDGTSISVLGQTPLASVQSLLLAAPQPTPYENLGVPGALLADVMSAYDSGTSYGAPVGSPNPFFDFINRSTFFGVPESTDPTLQPTMLVGGIAKGARVATFWIGNNDVLGGATAGTPVVGVTITDPTEFATQYATTLLTLAGGLAQRRGLPSYIVVGNIPSITDIPYFMTKATFETAIGMAWPWGYAEGNDDDGMLMTFTALSWAQDAANQGSALPGNYTLTSAEASIVASTVAAYNGAISNAISMVNEQYPGTCALFDANALMAGLEPAQKTHFLLLLPQAGGDVATAAGMTYFSLDGVHPNQKGYGVVANGVLEVINDLTGSSYPMVDISTLSWDPTYGQTTGPVSGSPILTRDAAVAMENMFR